MFREKTLLTIAFRVGLFAHIGKRLSIQFCKVFHKGNFDIIGSIFLIFSCKLNIITTRGSDVHPSICVSSQIVCGFIIKNFVEQGLGPI